MAFQVTIEGKSVDGWYYRCLHGHSVLSPDHTGIFETKAEAAAWVRRTMLEMVAVCPGIVGLDTIIRLYEGLRIGLPMRARGGVAPQGTLLRNVGWRLEFVRARKPGDEDSLRWVAVQDIGAPRRDAVRKINQPRAKAPRPAAAVGYDPNTGVLDDQE